MRSGSAGPAAPPELTSCATISNCSFPCTWLTLEILGVGVSIGVVTAGWPPTNKSSPHGRVVRTIRLLRVGRGVRRDRMSARPRGANTFSSPGAASARQGPWRERGGYASHYPSLPGAGSRGVAEPIVCRRARAAVKVASGPGDSRPASSVRCLKLPDNARSKRFIGQLTDSRALGKRVARVSG